MDFIYSERYIDRGSAKVVEVVGRECLVLVLSLPLLCRCPVLSLPLLCLCYHVIHLAVSTVNYLQIIIW